MNPQLALLLLLLTAAILGAQTDPGTSGKPARPEITDPSALSNLSFEAIGPGDLISVYVEDYPAVDRSYRVSSEGTIELPVMKQPIHVDGLKVRDVEKLVTKALTDSKLLVDPVVAVSVIEYRSKPVNIVGAVRQPVTVQAIGGLRLLDAISKADGLSPEAGPEIIVSRPDSFRGPGFVNQILVKDLIGGRDPSLNLVLLGGEEIRVPAAQKLYIAGNVKSPGVYPMDQNGGLTVLQALALCQGVLSFSQRVAVVYRATPGLAARVEINIPLRQIMKRHTPDVALVPNDILYIPDDSGRRVSMDVVERILGFGTAVGSGVLIFSNR